MNKLEELHQEAQKENVKVIDYHFDSDRIKGLYCDGSIALNERLKTSAERSCILSEELGHHFSNVGNMVDMKVTENRKQEHRARAWAYNKMIGLIGIVNAYENGCSNIHETADFLNVTEEFLQEALAYYKNKYGLYTTVDNYVIYFEPHIGVFELI